MRKNSVVIFYILDIHWYAAIEASHTFQKIQCCFDRLPTFIIRKVRLVRNFHNSDTHKKINQNQRMQHLHPKSKHRKYKTMLRKCLGKHLEMSTDGIILSFKITKPQSIKTFPLISGRFELELQQLWTGLQLIQANWSMLCAEAYRILYYKNIITIWIWNIYYYI